MINSNKLKNIIFIKKVQLWLGFFVLLLLIGCKSKNQILIINGSTMGTTYSININYDSHRNIEINSIKSKIDSVLQVINQQMSTYIHDSEISRFNRLVNKDWFTVSSDFYEVIVAAQKISKLTNGAFDITVGPIVDLWGFSTNVYQHNWQPPVEQEIKRILQSIGFNNIITVNNSIKKINIDTKIDLNAIAKGYGVDVVFELLKDLGFKNILVEIGGEVRCIGLNENGDPWRIGIDKPVLNILPGTELQAVKSLDNQALATSGDYRNYYEYNGELYSHMINPRTGYPTENHVASVSVTASNCMTADALATALMIMGKDGIELINNIDGIEAIIIIRANENTFNSIESSGWVEKQF